jgi:hypothetical protein
MKTIEVKITAEFNVPDAWEIIEHTPDAAFPDDHISVLKINDNYYDFFPECLMKVDAKDTVLWSTDEGKTEDVIDCMSQFRVRIQEKK